MSKSVEIKFKQIFINNEFVDAVSKKTFSTINPHNEEEICRVAEGDKADIDLAVKAAREAFKLNSTYRSMDASARGRLLYKLADEIEKDLDYIVDLEVLDCGKIAANAEGNMHFAISILRYFAGYADKVLGEIVPSDGNYFTYVRKEPVGVVAGITPWNYPFMLEVFKLAPAIAAGCTLVIKPAEQSPLSALYLAELTRRVGFPKGVVNIVPGYGPTAGAALSNHMDVNRISFTGSTEVGKLIMQAAGATNLKRVGLELGGKSPLIIFDDCPDLDKAVQTAFYGCLENSGQCCVAATRTYVHEKIYDQFVEKTKEVALKMIVGDPHQKNSQLGPMVDKTQFEKILDYINSGKGEGARLVTGGGRHAEKGYYIQPTVFADVQDRMKIAREEIFGPVQSIFKFSTMEEVIERANNTHYGLGAGVFTSNIDTSNLMIQALEAGTVWVNDYFAGAGKVPFGGYKMSGIGRENGPIGIEEFLEQKAVIIAIPKKNS